MPKRLYSGVLIGQDLQAGRLVQLLPGYRMADIDVLAVYPTRRHLSAKVRVMVDFLVEAFQPPLPWEAVESEKHSSAENICASSY